MSKSTRLYESDLKLDNASTLSLYVSTSNKPMSSKQRPKDLVISGSSSTINILPLFISVVSCEDEDIGCSEEILYDLYMVNGTNNSITLCG